MRGARDQATQRLEIFLPIVFTSFNIGLTPVRLFNARLAVSSVTFQASPVNTGRIHIGVDPNINTDYGFGLGAGAGVSWEVTLADIIQTLGWSGVENIPARGEILPQSFYRFRQPRLVIDAAQFYAVATVADQDLTVQFSTPPRY
jgi:hypothetical protein